MKLRSCHIDNFGKLSDLHLEFQDGVNLFHEPNAWGKSTLAAFLRVMFYGFDSKRESGLFDKERVVFRPWQGGTYGGELDFSYQGKEYRISRTFGKTEKTDVFHLYDLSTNLECDRKFRDFWFSGIALQRLSDIICLEHGLSVIPKVKPSERQRRTKYPERVSMRDVIREDILKCLDQKPADFEELLKFLQAEGYEIKRGKHTAVCGKEQKRFIRFRSLGEDFTEENLKKVIAGEKEPPEKIPERKEAKPEKRKFDLVVDIQEKMAQGKNGGYVQWAKKYNVKQFAESILFLQQHDIHDKETLDALVDGSSAKYHELMKTIKDAEEKMAANKVIKTHIINYAKTRETYITYRKSGYSKKFFEAHRDEITLHKAAKEAFSKLPDGKIPKVKDLNEEFVRLLSEKKAAYSEYKKIKKEMRDYQIAKQNVESFYAAQQSWDIEEDMKKKRQQER